MAPSAVEVETVTLPDVTTLKLQAAGPYKELAATKYDAEGEAGLKGHKAAKVGKTSHPPQRRRPNAH